MILCFSGTGNSRYVAKRIARRTGDDCVDLARWLRNGESAELVAEESLVIVAPIYAWRLPRIVEQWIRSATFGPQVRTWFVMTCGDEIGNAAKYNRRLCEDKNLCYMGTAEIVMPENYLPMFDVPDENLAARIIERAEPEIDRVGERIAEGKPFPVPRSTLKDRLKSSLVNPAFYALCVKADEFKTDENCNGCGTCAMVCPLDNIRLQNGKPEWGKNCTQCMACICRCPRKAIEYGRQTVGKPKYYCKAELTNDETKNLQ